MLRARGQLTRPFACAGLIVLAACSRPADAVPAAAPAAAPAASPAPSGTPAAAAAEATCSTAPLRVGVVAVRRERAGSVRVELRLANLAPARDWRPGSPVAASVRAAIEALDGLSLLSADGRRRMFALRGSTGQRVGSAIATPAPGRSETFWVLFPATDGPVSLLLPGFAPLTGLAVAPAPATGPPEP
jgi:hypothetical protein